MKDLIFVVKGDGSYEQVPNRNLRAQENYSDNFVVIANQVGVVKAKIKLLSRTDKVEVKYLVPSLENVYDLIGDKPYFQDYANANVWRGAVPKKLLQEVSMSYAGQVEVSFSFTKAVTDIRALEYKGEIYDDLPETASIGDYYIGDYYIIRLSSYTLGDTTWTYGQQAIWEDGWIKGGTYKVIGTTTTHRLNVEQSLKGEQAEFDTENEDEYLDTLQDHSGRINTLENTANDHELRISTNEQDIDNLENEIDDIKDGEIVIGKTYGDEHGNRITTTYATQNTLDDVVNQIENTGEIIAKKAEYAEKDESGRVIEEVYVKDVTITAQQTNASTVSVAYSLANAQSDIIKSHGINLLGATQSLAGVMSATDKTRLDNLHTNAERTANKGQAGGYAPLDSNTKLPLVYLYDSVLGQLEYVGTFDGATIPTMTQNLSPNRPVRKGDYFIANGDGIISGVDFKVGDWLIFDSATAWQKIDNTDAVASVNGKMGVVVLNGTDIEVGGGDTTKLNARFIGIDTILNDTYRKNDVYTKIETDNLLNQLKAIYGWEDEFVGELEHLDELSPNTISNYDFVVLELFSGSETLDETLIDTRIMKPADLVTNNLIGEDNFYLSIHSNPALTKYIYVQKDEINTGRKLKVYGVKMEQQKAENVTFENSDVDTELKQLGNEKADKAETRQIGEELITRTNGKVTSVDSDTVETTIIYDANGEVTEIIELYKLDGETYKTTFERDVDGNINKTKKELI